MNRKNRHNYMTSILLLLAALVAVSAATVAWFSITVNTRVRSMDLDVTAGISLRFDLDPHETFEEYVKTLGFEGIAKRIQKDLGYSMEETRLEPLTTQDYETFTYEDGGRSSPESGEYLEFTLHFMSKEDMLVHLTSESSSPEAADGTAVISGTEGLAEAMRISFAADGHTWVYDPGMGDTCEEEGDVTVFGLPTSRTMSYNKNNALFSMKAGENKEVRVHVWLEGTDEACTDDLKSAEYKISLRFEGEAKKTNQAEPA